MVYFLCFFYPGTFSCCIMSILFKRIAYSYCYIHFIKLFIGFNF